MSKTSIIYKLVSSKTDLVYIGSTTQSLHKRFIGHRKGSQTTRATILFDYGRDDVSIVELAKFENLTKEELEIKEYEIIKLYEDKVVNLKGTKNTVKKIKLTSKPEPIRIFDFDVITF